MNESHLVSRAMPRETASPEQPGITGLLLRHLALFILGLTVLNGVYWLRGSTWSSATAGIVPLLLWVLAYIPLMRQKKGHWATGLVTNETTRRAGRLRLASVLLMLALVEGAFAIWLMDIPFTRRNFFLWLNVLLLLLAAMALVFRFPLPSGFAEASDKDPAAFDLPADWWQETKLTVLLTLHYALLAMGQVLFAASVASPDDATHAMTFAIFPLLGMLDLRRRLLRCQGTRATPQGTLFALTSITVGMGLGAGMALLAAGGSPDVFATTFILPFVMAGLIWIADKASLGPKFTLALRGQP